MDALLKISRLEGNVKTDHRGKGLLGQQHGHDNLQRGKASPIPAASSSTKIVSASIPTVPHRNRGYHTKALVLKSTHLGFYLTYYLPAMKETG
jgi:hypothetical protein